MGKLAPGSRSPEPVCLSAIMQAGYYCNTASVKLLTSAVLAKGSTANP